MKAEEAQDAQIILADALPDVADEAHASRLEIFGAPRGIEQRAVRAGINRIDGEIAPARVFRPVPGEGDNRAPPVGGHVAPERRHLEWLAHRYRRHRAVLDAGRHRREPRLFQPLRHFIGRERRGDIDIGDGLTQQRIPDRAADEAGLAACHSERRHNRARLGRSHPGM